MIKRFLTWLKSLYYTPVATTETTKDIPVSKITLVSILTSQLANLIAANTVQVTVTDDAGVALVGSAVTFTADNGAVVALATGTTDANGQATASITSSVAGASTLTATLADGTSGSIQVYFVAVPATQAAIPSLTLTPSGPLAEFKAKAEAFFEFVEHGIEVLGEEAEAELVALKAKYL